MPDEVKDYTPEAIDAAVVAEQKALDKAADLLTDAIRAAAPKGVTGDLAASVYELGRDENTVVVGTRDPIAHLIEYGTHAHNVKHKKAMSGGDLPHPIQRVRGTSSRPFVREGFEASRLALPDEVRNAFKEALRAALPDSKE